MKQHSLMTYLYSEISDGIMMYDENDNELVKSRAAATKGIAQVLTSRIIMAAPGMSEYY
mgnify:CR=1 FL=1